MTLSNGEAALVLSLKPTEPAVEYEADVTTAPLCGHCGHASLRHFSGSRWQCPECGRAADREELREWAIRYIINLGRFCDPIGASNEEWQKWWDAWEAEIRADAVAAERLVNNL